MEESLIKETMDLAMQAFAQSRRVEAWEKDSGCAAGLDPTLFSRMKWKKLRIEAEEKIREFLGESDDEEEN